MTPTRLTWTAVYTLLGVSLTWPLLLHMGGRVPNDPGDSLLNVFLLAWNARELPLTERWWNLPQFYPVPGAMAFSEHLIGVSVLTTPVIALTGNALLGYNVAFLLSFPLSALAAHALAYHLTRRHDVALVAGVAFAFAPYRMAQLAHVQVLSSYWMPLALLGLHRFLEDRRAASLGLFAACWYLQALACGYYLFYLSVLVGVWILWFAIGRLAWKDLLRIGAAWAMAIAAMVPFALGYLRHLGAYGFSRGQEEIEFFSADLASVLSTSGNLRLWGWLNVFGRPEAELFPGLAVVAVIAVAAGIALRAQSGENHLRRRRAWILAGAAVVCALVAVSPIWYGPWRLEIGGVRLVSVGTAGKPLLLGLLLGMIALVVHPAGTAAWRRRSPLMFYAGAAVLLWLLALGPSPTVLGQPLFDAASSPYYAPYAWLMMVPGVDGVRVPARFWMLVVLCLAVACALAAGRVAAHWPRRGSAVLLGIAALVTLEGWPAPVRLWPAPAPRPSSTDAVARLEIPMGPGRDVVALFRAAEHRLPVFNGYSGYFAPHYGVLMDLISARDPDVLSRLASVGPIEVVVDHANDPAAVWRTYVSSQPGARVAARSRDYTLYRVPATPPPSEGVARRGTVLPIVRVDASVHPEAAAFMLDNDLETRWHTGPQMPDNEVTIDLGTARRVNGVELQLGGFHQDFPRDFVLDLSGDGSVWTTAWSGRTAADALWAAIEDPRTLPLRFAAGGAEARYIRMRQTAEDPIFYWSIAELKVYGQ